MMLILACAKKLVFFDRAARRGDYDIRNRVKGMDLEGKTLGLLEMCIRDRLNSPVQQDGSHALPF